MMTKFSRCPSCKQKIARVYGEIGDVVYQSAHYCKPIKRLVLESVVIVVLFVAVLWAMGE